MYSLTWGQVQGLWPGKPCGDPVVCCLLLLHIVSQATRRPGQEGGGLSFRPILFHVTMTMGGAAFPQLQPLHRVQGLCLVPPGPPQPSCPVAAGVCGRLS